MTEGRSYSYVVLRYVHDVLTGEFVNVGVIMLTPAEGKLRTQTRKTIRRIRGVFPDLDKMAFVQLMRTVDRGLQRVRKQVANAGLFSDQKDAGAYARVIVPSDDSSLQWSSVGSGLTNNADATFERLYERYVSQYDTSAPHRKSDEDVWRPVKEQLSQRGLKVPLEKKIVRGTTDSIEFSRAWENGRWHVYEPVSLDLADADGIKDKVRRWRGHLAAVADGAEEDLQIHFVLGRPVNRSLLPAYRNAIEILKGAPFDPEIFEENQIDKLVDEIEDEMKKHQAAEPGRVGSTNPTF